MARVVKSVSVKEFRDNLARHLKGSEPVAVTKHGFTMGYFIPTRRPNETDRAALAEASRRLSQLLEEQSLESEALIHETIALRKADKRKRRD